MAPITGALNARAAPHRSAETVFCFSFQPNAWVTSAVDVAFQNRGGFQRLVDPAVMTSSSSFACRASFQTFPWIRFLLGINDNGV